MRTKISNEERLRRARDASRRWRDRNKDLCKAKNAEYRDKNIEKIRARDAKIKRDLRLAFPEKHKAERAKYKAENLDKIKATERRYRELHKEKARDQHKAWLKRTGKQKEYASRARTRHANSIRARNAARRALKKGAKRGNQSTIVAWEKRWRGKSSVRCFWCNHRKGPSECHTDHITSLKAGGHHSVENLCISCATCNLSKQAASLDQWNAKIQEPVLL